MSSQNPFSLDNSDAYKRWREQKLKSASNTSEVTLDPLFTKESEIEELKKNCREQNFSLFKFARTPERTETAIQQLGLALGLSDIDSNLCAEDSGITEIRVKETSTDNVYIPYTNRPLGWHTDGYYNMPNQQIHGWLLYCGHPAMQGGINGLLDHELLYIKLRDQNPEWIAALMASDAFTIPGNIEGGKVIRGDSVGPVFSINPDGHSLHMRYSARQRNVQWKDDANTQAAASAILDLLNSDDDHILYLTLKQGQGIISNNVLHNRSSFTDSDDPSQRRVIYRARYHNRVV
jgi:hypothetical protein